MQWKGRKASSNIEDRRGGGAARVAKGGGIIAVVALIASQFLGVDASMINALLSSATGGSGSTQAPVSNNRPLANEKEKQFVAVVLKDTEDVWSKIFANMGRKYKKPKLVLFSQTTQSGCGKAEASMGPFYCPAPNDHKVYLDLSFFKELARRHHAKGDFAQAYVVAHEIAHHVQSLLGTSGQVSKLQNQYGRGTPEANKLSVMLELQADCYSGVWAHHAQKMKNILDEGDIEEALNAASQIGDDTLQKQAGIRNIHQESFTHGTSKQRVSWFRTGFRTGSLEACDTFK